MLLMKDLLCSVLLSAVIACAVSSCACVCGWFLIEVTSKNLLDDLFFCDNRVMAKRTTLLTIVFRVIMKSILRPSEGRLLRCFTHMIGLMLSSVALLGYSVLCHLACMAHHVLAKVCYLLVSLPVVAAASLHCLKMHLDRAQISLVSFRCSFWFRFSRPACACCLAVFQLSLLCSRRLDSDLLARVLSAWFSFSFHLICDAYALCTHLLDKLPL